MKKSFTLLFLLLISPGVFIPLLGQSPEKFSYQAVIRDNVNQLVINQSIGVQISILQGSATGTAVYVETHTPMSNANGLITLEVGGGSVLSGSFSAIDWASGPYFIKTEADPTGGTGYTITGVSQLISVPYALHAGSADTVTGPLTETDPVFGASTAAGITPTDTATWHAKLDTEVDPVFGAWDRSTGITITESQVTDLQNYLLTESDPAFNASVAAGITGADTASWNAKLDTEVDPVFSAWDRSTGITITESQVTDLQNYLLTESDPVFNASVAAGITSSDTASWNQKLDHYTETQQLSDVLSLGNNANATQIKNLADPTDPQDAVTKIYVDNQAMPSGVAAGEMLFWDGAQWIPVHAGTHGQTLTFCFGVPTWGPCPTAPGQPSHINGTTDPCENETGLFYYVTQEADVTYTWTVPTGWNITDGQGTHEITVTAGSAAGTIEVTPSNVAGSGPSRTLSVTTKTPPVQPSAIIGDINPCDGDSETYTVTDQGATYTWSVPAGWNIVSGQNTHQITVIVGSNSGEVSVLPANSCGNGIEQTLMVTLSNVPAQPAAIMGEINPCEGASETYTVTDQGATYTWSVPAGWNITSGQETHQVTVVADSAGGIIQVTPSNACGSGVPQEITVTIQHAPAPPTEGVHVADTTSVEWHWNAVTGATGYRWSDTNDYVTAVDKGNATSHNETGLVCGMSYTRYVWAYDDCGQSTALTIMTSTSAVGCQGAVFATHHSGYVHCDPANPTAVVDVTNPVTGIVWMDRNLGASQVATSITDTLAHGDLYQWGRFADGHQCRNSATTTTLSSTDRPGHGDFIIGVSSPGDWRNPHNTNLWQGVSGLNNPCPTDYRLPTEAELEAERLTWISDNAAGAFASPLKLPQAGWRRNDNGSLQNVGSSGRYWSGTVSYNGAKALYYTGVSAHIYPLESWRANGFSVRCVKDVSTPFVPTQPSFINGPVNPCENDTGLVYHVIQEPDVVYSWTVPNGWSITAGQGTHEITVTAGNFTFGTSDGNIEVTPSNLAGSGSLQSLAVTTSVCAQSGTYPAGYVHCDPANPTAVVDVTNPITGDTWMDRNLGASQVAGSSTDALAFGDLFQWGRFADGHQCRNSDTTSALSSTDQPGHGYFIVTPNNPGLWRTSHHPNLWQGVNGVNNPCPTGYRLPTQAELWNERNSWSGGNAAGAFDSPLKLPRAGSRWSSGEISLYGGRYHISGGTGTQRTTLVFDSPTSQMSSYNPQSRGASVRCIKHVATLSPPAQPSPINGTTDPCENETGLIYNVSQEIGITFTWTVPTGWSITAGQGTHEITVNAGTADGIIEVTPSNTAGNGPSQTLAVNTQMCASTPSYPTGTVQCDPSNPTAVVDVTNPITGRTWMDRNLGAAQAATSSTDSLAYGDFYQWGRFADGHQCRNSATTTTLSTTDQPGHGDFIIAPTQPNNWHLPINDNLWQGVNGMNNPCPAGYRLPTDVELNNEMQSWNSSDASGAFASPLKLTMTGRRDGANGAIHDAGSIGTYWSSTIFGYLSRMQFFDSNISYISNHTNRSHGLSVRCIKDI